MNDLSTGSAIADDLLPFASLTTDEERERKAERSSPGTYHVIVNQDSFQHLLECSDAPDVKKELLSPPRRGSVVASFASNAPAVEGISSGDPNVVVLPRFQDVARHGISDPRSPISSATKHNFIKGKNLDEAVVSEDPVSLDDTIPIDRYSRYLRQFRYVVWTQFVPTELDVRDGMVRPSANIFEDAAREFPPVRTLQALLASANLL